MSLRVVTAASAAALGAEATAVASVSAIDLIGSTPESWLYESVSRIALRNGPATSSTTGIACTIFNKQVAWLQRVYDICRSHPPLAVAVSRKWDGARERLCNSVFQDGLTISQLDSYEIIVSTTRMARCDIPWILISIRVVFFQIEL